MFDGIGPQQLLIVLVIVLILFGSRIPEVMKGLGTGLREFKKGIREEPKEESKEALTAE
jgi:sec-independent protein translocase protein TatA